MDFTPPQQLSPFKAKQDDGLGIVEEKKTIIIRGRRFESSDRIGMASSWVPLSNAILNSSYVNNKLPIAVSMESHDNHEIKFEKLYQIFTNGNKLNQAKVNKELLCNYMDRLENKETTRKIIAEIYERDQRTEIKKI